MDRKIILALKDAQIVIKKVIEYKRGLSELPGDTFLHFTFSELTGLLNNGPTFDELPLRGKSDGTEVRALSGTY